MAGLLGGCEDMSSGQKGAVTGGALGTGIGVVAGGNFGRVVGAGLRRERVACRDHRGAGPVAPDTARNNGFVWRCLARPCCQEDG